MSQDRNAAYRIDRRHLVSGAAATAVLSSVQSAAGAPGARPGAATLAAGSQPVSYRTTDVEGLSIFYREAGDPSRPTLLLLHGFPSSSHMFRDLIPLLAGDFHLVAPDYPGFG